MSSQELRTVNNMSTSKWMRGVALLFTVLTSIGCCIDAESVSIVTFAITGLTYAVLSLAEDNDG